MSTLDCVCTLRYAIIFTFMIMDGLELSWTLLLSHHGVKQCFYTMDVAANNWATAASNPAGPISAKSTILMKNATIFVAKHTKNLAKNGAWQST